MTITVKRGETLASIAQRYGVSAEDIRKWNRLSSSKVRRGMRLKIRTSETAARSADRDSVGPAIAVEPAPLRVASRERMSKHGPVEVIVVKRGDTLSSLARRHGVTVQALQRVNRLGSARIRAGQKLKLPIG
jgi:membrane-bound lytic murein transglycosylase D